MKEKVVWQNVAAVIMAGGVGERFWPNSRKKTPKQLLPITGGKSMLQETVSRLEGLIARERIFISTNAQLAPLILKNLEDFSPENLILEPFGRDTAACIGLAAITLNRRLPGGSIIILAADHYIPDKDDFQLSMRVATKTAKQTGCLITLGIRPNRPETGYGYIHLGEVIHTVDGKSAYEVRRFVEKPDLTRAEKFLKDDHYLWNSGMFVFTCNAILEALELYMPKLYEGILEIGEALEKTNEQAVKEKVFEGFDKISIDYGVMEKATNVLCIEADFGWDDVGSWSSLERIFEGDANGNIVFGEFESLDTKDSIIHSDGGLIATIGLKDIIIVKSHDAVFICNKHQDQEIKKLLHKLSADDKYRRYL